LHERTTESFNFVHTNNAFAALPVSLLLCKKKWTQYVFERFFLCWRKLSLNWYDWMYTFTVTESDSSLFKTFLDSYSSKTLVWQFVCLHTPYSLSTKCHYCPKLLNVRFSRTRHPSEDALLLRSSLQSFSSRTTPRISASTTKRTTARATVSSSGRPTQPFLVWSRSTWTASPVFHGRACLWKWPRCISRLIRKQKALTALCLGSTEESIIAWGSHPRPHRIWRNGCRVS